MQPYIHTYIHTCIHSELPAQVNSGSSNNAPLIVIKTLRALWAECPTITNDEQRDRLLLAPVLLDAL